MTKIQHAESLQSCSPLKCHMLMAKIDIIILPLFAIVKYYTNQYVLK